jgi:hypothetical protein
MGGGCRPNRRIYIHMRVLKRNYKLVALAASCVALGAVVSAIASAGAATPASGTTSTASSAAAQHRGRGALARRTLAGAVQGSVVVHTRSGFATVTFERGVVKSVSGNQLTITERTRNAVYKDMTVTIPSNARIRVNKQKATLGQLKSGQRVMVVSAPKRTLVVARG